VSIFIIVEIAGTVFQDLVALSLQGAAANANFTVLRIHSMKQYQCGRKRKCSALFKFPSSSGTRQLRKLIIAQQNNAGYS